MKLSDLKVGDIVKTREGNYLIILSNPHSKIGLGTFSQKTYGCQEYLCSYNEDLTHKDRDRSHHDIVAVLQASEPTTSSSSYSYTLTRAILTDNNPSKDFEYVTWDWEREKPVKEMTMTELEKHFGCKVKIIK